MTTEINSPQIDLYDRLRMADTLAVRLVQTGQLQGSLSDLRMILNAQGGNPTAVLSDWIHAEILNEPDYFHDQAEALSYLENLLRRKILQTFPDANVV